MDYILDQPLTDAPAYLSLDIILFFLKMEQLIPSPVPPTSPFPFLLFSAAAQAVRHSCSSGEGIKPAEPETATFRACQ